MKIESNLTGGKRKTFRAADVRLPALMASLMVLAAVAPAVAQENAPPASAPADVVQSPLPADNQPATAEVPAAASEAVTPTATAIEATPSGKPGATAANPVALDTVIVTSRRKSEKLQDVPLSISAFRAKDLQAAGVKSLQDLSALTSGLTINDDGTETAVAPTIRGVSDLAIGSSENNVGIYLDGIYLVNPAAVNLGLVDIERIEVIKGPVSALYGRNAYAGAINYVSHQPDDFVAGHISSTIGNYGQQTLIGSVGGPVLGDALRMKIAAGYEKSDGGYTDSQNGLKAGGKEKKDAQLSFTSKLFPGFNIAGSAYYGDDFFDEPALTYLDNNCGTRSTNAVSTGQFTQYCGQFFTEQHPVEVALIPAAAGASGNSRVVTSDSLKFSQDFSWGTAALLTGYNQVTQQRFADFTGRRDGIPFQVRNADNSLTIVNLQELFGSDNNNEDYSAELRFSSKQDQPLRWAFGGYYFDATSTNTTLIGINGMPLQPGQKLTNGTAALFLTPNGSFSKSNFTQVDNNGQVISEFASVDYDILPKLTLNVEYRHTDEDKEQDIVRNAFVANTVRPFGAPTKASFGYDNHRAGLRYKITKDVMVYGSYADGTKAGGFNSRATIPSEISFQPETSENYELGAKTRFLEGRLQANVALFNIDTKNLQIAGASDDAKNAGLVTKNFGGSTSKGLELDLSALFGYGISGTFGLGYADPKFTSGTYDFSNAAVCSSIPSCAPDVITIQTPQGARRVVDLEGKQTPRSSQYQISTGLAYEALLVDRWKSFTRLDLRYEDRQFATPLGINYWGNRTKINLREGVDNGLFRITAFVDNLTNDKTPALVSANTYLNDFLARPSAYLPIGRTYGLNVDYRF